MFRQNVGVIKNWLEEAGKAAERCAARGRVSLRSTDCKPCGGLIPPPWPPPQRIEGR